MYTFIRVLLLILIPTLLYAGPLQEEAFKIAIQDSMIPVIEKTNANDHPRIDQYCKNVGIPLHSPYCAAAVYTWYKEGSEVLKIKNPAPRTGATAQIYKVALANPMRYKFIKPRLVRLGSEQIQLGDIQLFSSNPSFTHGHTAFSIYQVKLEGVANIEANTTASNVLSEQREQTREGKNKGGVYLYKYRPFTDSPNFTLKGWVRIRNE